MILILNRYVFFVKFTHLYEEICLGNIKSYNPATLELVGTVRSVGAEEVPEILTRSKEAQVAWGKKSLKERLKIIKEIDEYVSEHIDEVVNIISKETGKPPFEALTTDLFSGFGTGKFVRESAEKILQPRKINLGSYKLAGHSSYIHYRPLGVVVIISPWNFPWGIPYSEVIMALAAGNSVVLKPSSETPLTALKMQECMVKAGLPKNTFIVVPGGGSTVGKALAESEVGRIIFTGSTLIGKNIMKTASNKLVPITLELGGKDPLVVLKDADLKRTTRGIAWAAFVNAGQVCAGAKRVYVQRQIYDDFLELFKERVEQLKLGYGLEDPTVTTGPLINEQAVKDMEEFIEQAVREGAKILTGGKRPEGMKGHFFEPTVLYQVKNSDMAVQEEIFGPIVTVLPYETTEEAIKLANDNDYALTGSVWTADLELGQQIAEKLNPGTVAVNNHALTYAFGETPWGGGGKSGLGRTHGELGLLELVEPHHIHIDKMRLKRDPWWHPYNGKEDVDGIKPLIDILYLKRYWKILTDGRKLMKLL